MNNRKREGEELELESTATSVRKRPRRSVQKQPKDTERERNSTGQVELSEQRDLTGEAIHGNIELIWDCLKENRARILGIYGMGGVGKTAIVTRIHNKLVRDATFNVVYITVSKDFSIHKLQSDIGKALEIRNMEGECEMRRAAMLSERLKEKKNCVLILDDVWEFLDLKEVGIPVEADGFKLVLTTRSSSVCHQMQCQEMIKIKPLSQEEAESLFLEELGSKVPPNLEIVKSIVKECAGLPIGVITMAGSMRGVTDLSKWRVALERLKESSMGQTDMKNKVLMILKFSYDHLGNPDVQQCFLSCALYPEDELINKSELVEFFIDQGLFDGLNKREEQYNRGLTILNKLRNVSLLEDHGTSMKMHDLHRDMALHIMGATSIVKAGKQLMRIPLEECWTDKLEKVSLMINNIEEFPSKVSPNCPKLSTLLLRGGWYAIPDSFFKNLLGLKVLNLSGNDMTKLPNSISDLVNLRALLLKGCFELRRIPYLGKLTSLRKLDAECCLELKALKGLEKLVNLRYLDLTGTGILRLPDGTLDCLVNLQCLKVEAVNEKDITKLGALETFICQHPGAEDFNRAVRVIEQRVIKQSDNPHYYNIFMSLIKYCHGENLVQVSNDAQFRNLGRTVYIAGWGHAIVSVGRECTGKFILIPRDVLSMSICCCKGIKNLSGMGLLEYLEELDIDECENLGVLCGGQGKEVNDIHDSPASTPTAPLFPNLRVLKIEICPKLKYLFGHGSKSNLPPTPTAPLFPNLRVLKIEKCPKLEYLFRHGSKSNLPPTPTAPLFPNLRVLKIYVCRKLKYLFGHGSKSNLPHLQKIKICQCEEMVGIIAAVTSAPPHLLPFFPSLEEIFVEGCNKMKRVVESEWMPHFPNLRRIKVSECEKMEEMIGGPPPYLPIPLESLVVDSCNKMRKLFLHEWLHHLQTLQTISVVCCNRMVEMISGAGQGQESRIMTPVNNTTSSFQPSSISLPELEWLKLWNLPQLKSICEVPISCDFLKDLFVYDCPELKGIPLHLRLHDIEDLPHIRVEDADMGSSRCSGYSSTLSPKRGTCGLVEGKTGSFKCYRTGRQGKGSPVTLLLKKALLLEHAFLQTRLKLPFEFTFFRVAILRDFKRLHVLLTSGISHLGGCFVVQPSHYIFRVRLDPCKQVVWVKDHLYSRNVVSCFLCR